MFDIRKFLNDFGISSVDRNHRHSTSGWINIDCPFCSGKNDYHLGFNVNGVFFHCWRCGGHSVESTIKELLSTDYPHAVQLKEQYQTTSFSFTSTVEEIKNAAICQLPPRTEEMGQMHKNYLIKRNFDPEKLARVWGLKGTILSPMIRYEENGIKKTTDYSYRIIAPVTFNKRLVSYQARDVTGQATIPYKMCPKPLEVINIKKVLYGWDLIPDDTVVISEGIADAWRLGPGALSTFGVGYTKDQVFLLPKFRRVFIFFDSDDPGKKEADRLAYELRRLMDEEQIQIVELKGVKDPGELNQDEADYFMKDIGIRREI
jgi:hypothetical protein